MINLNEWPLKGEEHPSYDQNSGEYIIALTWKQYELAAKAVRDVEEYKELYEQASRDAKHWEDVASGVVPVVKELPDEEGWWWYMAATTSTWVIVFLDEDLDAGYVAGRWIKINEPEGK